MSGGELLGRKLRVIVALSWILIMLHLCLGMFQLFKVEQYDQHLSIQQPSANGFTPGRLLWTHFSVSFFTRRHTLTLTLMPGKKDSLTQDSHNSIRMCQSRGL